jgi:hypothetical protein
MVGPSWPRTAVFGWLITLRGSGRQRGPIVGVRRFSLAGFVERDAVFGLPEFADNWRAVRFV